MRRDFRQIIDFLEKEGELVRIKKKISPNKEMAALMWQLEQQNKAFIFENVENSDMPAVGGLFTSYSRLGLVFNEKADGDFTRDDIGKIIQDATQQPTETIKISSGPVNEVVLSEDEVNLEQLPIPTFFELDSGAFITAAVGIFRKPEGHLNVGFYRTNVVDKNHVLINASGLSDLRKSYDWHRENKKKMAVAMVIGVPPWLLMAAAAKSPNEISELEVAGSIAGSGLEMIQCQHSDLLVPAEAEMVIETEVDLNNMLPNTLGEFGDQYGTEEAPLATVKTITKRKDAMFYTLMAGRAKEHSTLGHLAVYGLVKAVMHKIKANNSSITAIKIHNDTKIGPLMHVVVAIKKVSDEQPEKIIKEIFNTDMGWNNLSWIAKRVIIVDEDIDITNMDDVEWATWTRVGRAEKIHLYSNFITWEIDRAALPDNTSLRVGIDATKDLDQVDNLVRPVITGIDDVDLKDYLD